MSGSTFKRCGCLDPVTRKQLGPACPLLDDAKHGSWGFRLRVEGARIGRGGYRTEKLASADLRRVQVALDAADGDDKEARRDVADLLDRVLKAGQPIPTVEDVRRRLNLRGGVTQRTLGEWLDVWLEGRKKIRPATAAKYEEHIRIYWRPALGHVRLDRIQPEQIDEVYRAMRQLGSGTGGDLEATLIAARHKLRRHDARPVSPATIQRVHATLRAALNAAVKRRLIPHNVATFVELETTERGPVRVWLPEQVGAFLDATAEDRFGVMWHLIVAAGLRRGEAVGLRWSDVDLDIGQIRIAEQVTNVRGKRQAGAPKSRSGARVVSLDLDTIDALKAHRVRQNADRLTWGEAWVESGRVFTREDGSELNPDSVSQRFERTSQRLGLPKIRLHDLRHTSASLGLASGETLHEIKERLGHSTITVTSDFYTHVLPAVAKDSAERRARVIPRKPSGAAGHTLATRAPSEESKAAYRKVKPQVTGGGAGRTRTGDRGIMSDSPAVPDEATG